MDRKYYGLLMATASLVASSAAYAQDAPPADTIRATRVNWSGPYIGVEAGVTSVKSKLFGVDINGGDGGGDNDGPWGPLSFPHGNLVATGVAGYNIRVNDFVFGIEGDVSKPVGGSSGGNISEDLYPGPGGMFSVTSKWDASLRGRLGFLAGERLLLFGTAGVSFARFPAHAGEEIDLRNSNYYERYPNWGKGIDIGTGNGKSKSGFTVGAGAEYALGNHWKLRADYRYTDYGVATYNYIYDPTGLATKGSVGHKVSTNRFLVGMIYTFGSDERGMASGIEGSGLAERNWTGFHIGTQIGASATRTRFSGVDNNYSNGCEGPCGNLGGGDNIGPWQLVTMPHMSVLAGITAGYDLQFGRMVLGIEADANRSSGAANAYATEDRYPGPGGLWSVTSKWNAGIRGRLGFAAGDRALLYGVGGVTFAKFRARGGMEPELPSEDFYERYPNWGNRDIGGGTRSGLTFGGGIEYALDSNVSFKAEYRVTNFGRYRLNYDMDQALANCDGCHFEQGNVGNRIRVNSFLFGLNYRLGSPDGRLATTSRSSWTGFHLGAALGASRNNVGFKGYDPNSNDEFLNDQWGTVEPIRFSLSGVTAGAYAGYDYQVGGMVLGIEADANHTSGASESGRLQEQDNPDNGQWHVETKWSASLRARAGFLVTPDLLAYATGGVAYGKVFTNTGFEMKSSGPEAPPWGNANISKSGRYGPTYGGGMEYALSEALTLRTEYRHSDYGRKIFHYDSDGTDATITSTLKEDRISLGLGFTFGRHAPPAYIPPPPPPPPPPLPPATQICADGTVILATAMCPAVPPPPPPPPGERG